MEITGGQKIADALRSAESILIKGRDRIQKLRVPGETSDDLAQSFARRAAKLALDSDTEVRVLEGGRSRMLQLAIFEASYLIRREALTNAFRHANARTIEVQLIGANYLGRALPHQECCSC